MLRVTTAMAAALAASTIAGAALADCTTSGTTITCTGTTITPIDSGETDLNITIEPGATLATGADRAIDLSGVGQFVDNAGTVISDDDAVRASGPRVSLRNAGRIESIGEKAIALEGDADAATIINEAGGEIIGGDEAIEADNDDLLETLTIENAGLIDGGASRAVQSRGRGTTVLNSGTMTGREEVIEARDDFTLENSGTIRLADGVVDEDGVQFASGDVTNFGLIQGSDDGIDLDEGTIFNSGTIRSAPPAGASGGSAIDADDVFDAGGVERQPGEVAVVNSGLIEGPQALGVDGNRTAAFGVSNFGTLRGTTGPAIAFNAAMAASGIAITGDSVIDGDVLLTDSDDGVAINQLTSGTIIGNGIFDGRGGTDTVSLSAYELSDIEAFSLTDNVASLTLTTAGGTATAGFLNFEFWQVGGGEYTTAALAAATPPAATVPLPAGLPLLGAGLAGLYALRRRRA